MFEMETKSIMLQVLSIACLYVLLVEIFALAIISALADWQINAFNGPALLSSLPLVGYLPFISNFPHHKFWLLSKKDSSKFEKAKRRQRRLENNMRNINKL